MSIQKEMIALGVPSGTARAIAGSVETGITATGSTSQANSYGLTKGLTVFSTTAANTGARLRSDLAAGDVMCVQNNGASTLLLYPPVGGAINGGTTNASVNVATLKGAMCTCIDGLNFSVVVGA